MHRVFYVDVLRCPQCAGRTHHSGGRPLLAGRRRLTTPRDSGRIAAQCEELSLRYALMDVGFERFLEDVTSGQISRASAFSVTPVDGIRAIRMVIPASDT